MLRLLETEACVCQNILVVTNNNSILVTIYLRATKQIQTFTIMESILIFIDTIR